MRIVSHKKLKEFYEMSGNEDSRVALERWYDVVDKASWRNFSAFSVSLSVTLSLSVSVFLSVSLSLCLCLSLSLSLCLCVCV